jgi:hypothetical protein
MDRYKRRLFPEAEELFKRSLTGLRKALGPKHPHTVLVRQTLQKMRQDMAIKVQSTDYIRQPGRR